MIQIQTGARMNVDDISSIGIAVTLLFIFSAFMLIRYKGWRNGSIYLVAMVFVGIILAIISKYFNDVGKYALATLILLVGLLFSLVKRKAK